MADPVEVVFVRTAATASRGGTKPGEVRVVDVTNPAAGQELSSWVPKEGGLRVWEVSKDPIQENLILAKLSGPEGAWKLSVLDLRDPKSPVEVARIEGQDGSLYDGVVNAAIGKALASTRVKAAMETQEPQGLFTGPVVPGSEMARAELQKAERYLIEKSGVWDWFKKLCGFMKDPKIVRALPLMAGRRQKDDGSFSGTPAYQMDTAEKPNLKADGKPAIIPSFGYASIPLPKGADGPNAVGPVSIPKGKNMRPFYHVLKVEKPSSDGKITGIAVSISVGDGFQEIYQTPEGQDEDTSWLGEKVYPFVYEEPNAPDSAILPTLKSKALQRLDKAPPLPTMPVSGKTAPEPTWTWLREWLPTAPDPAGLVEYYLARTSFPGEGPTGEKTSLKYGDQGQHRFPTGQDISYAFKVRIKDKDGVRWSKWFSTAADEPARVHRQGMALKDSPRVGTRAQWSVVQPYASQGRIQGPYNADDDKWCNFGTYAWARGIAEQRFSATDPEGNTYNGLVVMPNLNDVSREHGGNPGHQSHFAGNAMDVFHPGGDLFRRTLSRVEKNEFGTPSGAGTAFRNQLLQVYAAAIMAPTEDEDSAVTERRTLARKVLAKWVWATRKHIHEMFNEDGYIQAPMGTTKYRIQHMIYLSNRPDSTARPLAQLLIHGQTWTNDSETGELETVLDLGNKALGLWKCVPWGDEEKGIPKGLGMDRLKPDDHTHHAHLEIRPKNENIKIFKWSEYFPLK